MKNYLDVLRGEFKGKHELELEQMCARTPALQKLTGRTEHQHRIAAMKLLCPHRVMHPWRERMIRSWAECRRDKKREILWLGSAMSGKTGTMADLLLELLWENPTNTTILIASPYEQATRGRLWAEIVKSFQIATSRFPFLLGTIKKSAGKIEVSEIHLRSGIEMVSVDDHGKLIGGNNDDVTSGNFILATDELPNVPNNASELLSGVGNMKMRPSFTFMGAGNFAETSDGLGTAAEPDLPGGYEALDVDTDHQWDTLRGGRVYRFDGMLSPNVIAKRDDYPFLTRWEVVKDYIDKKRTDTADFYRWVRSFPVIGHDSKTILTSPAIRAGHALEDPEFTPEYILRGGTCDPGFGGDPCILTEFRIGWAMFENKRIQVLHFPNPPTEVPLRIKKGMTEETVNKQIVEYSRDWAERRQIAPRDFGFDGSMRAGIVQEFMRGWSVETNAIDFGGMPSVRKMSANSKKLWKEEVFNFVTELWLAFQLLVEGGQARGLQNHDAGVRQLCNRQWRWSGKKKQIETKDEYKSRNSGHSPNEADTLVLALEMARRRGFLLTGCLPEGGGAVQALKEMERLSRARALMGSLHGNSLPPGRLHSMESGQSLNRGRLNS